MLQVAIAQSVELDSSDAVVEALDQCREQLGTLKPQAGLLFAGIDYDFPVILGKIHDEYPDLELIGCTTDGEISSALGYTDDSVTLTLLCSDILAFKAGVADGVSERSTDTVRKAVDSTVEGFDPVLCITTPSGLTSNGDLILEGIRQSLGESFPIFGGTAGDQWRFKYTSQFHGNHVFSDAAPFLLISGPLLYSSGVEAGWMPIGQKKVATRSDNRIVYEIGDEKALDFYKHHLGEDIGVGDAGAISEYPLAVYEKDDESFYLRSSIALDRETGNLTFVGKVPEGSTVQITHSTRDNIVEAVNKSVRSSVAEYPGTTPLVALCFSCTSRKQVLGTRVGEEYSAYKTSAPGLPVAGFYTYGEIGPLQRGKPARFHNETFISLLLGLE